MNDEIDAFNFNSEEYVKLSTQEIERLSRIVMKLSLKDLPIFYAEEPKICMTYWFELIKNGQEVLFKSKEKVSRGPDYEDEHFSYNLGTLKD